MPSLHQPQRPLDPSVPSWPPFVHARLKPTREGERHAASIPPASGRLIWDGERQAFVSAVLREAMIVRGFTPESLRLAAGVAHGTVYNALAGRVIRLTTARRILATLAGVEPAFTLSDLA
jgi:hypothetical protein